MFRTKEMKKQRGQRQSKPIVKRRWNKQVLQRTHLHHHHHDLVIATGGNIGGTPVLWEVNVERGGRQEQKKRGRINRIRIGRAGLDCSEQDFSAPSAVQQSAWVKRRTDQLACASPGPATLDVDQ